ncbi:NB-ARC domain-containing protein [Microcoleus sp. A2-C5]|uniref:NB-ARC domain-containing protein n=1 Tax=unclassified Microcoleus TaxID=2642155 RepID=UPI002FD3F46E
MNQISQEKFTRVLNGLTPQQQRVLGPFLEGESDQAIAQSLKIDDNTVKQHIRAICKKFRLSDETNKYASKRGDLRDLFRRYKPELVREVTSVEVGEIAATPESNPDTPTQGTRCRRVWGRDRLIEQILDRLTDLQEAPILSLTGGAGYGKTEVASQVAKIARNRNLFADVLWVKARDTELIDSCITQSERNEVLNWNRFLHEIAHQLDKCPTERVCQRLKEEKRLIVLDNAETSQVEEIVTNLVEMLNPSRVLLTSRLKTNAPFVGLIEIEGLNTASSYNLLQDEAKYKNIQALLQASPAQLARVHHLSRGAPLALHFIIGRVLEDRALEPVLSALEAASGDVEKFYEFSLQTAWQRISNSSKNVLRYMGNSDAGVTWEELLGAGRVEELECQQARRELRRWYLIEDELDAKANQRYNLHPWVRRSLHGKLVDKWEPSLQELEQIVKWKFEISI